MIKHSSNADNKNIAHVEEKKELVEEVTPKHMKETENSFIEDSTGASNIQIQKNTPIQTSEGTKETSGSPENKFASLLSGKVAEAVVKNVKHQMISEMLEAEPHVAQELGAILEQTTTSELMAKIKEKAIKKSYKVAGKSTQAQVIKLNDFKFVFLSTGSGDGVSQEFINSIQDKVCVSPKFPELLQLKSLEFLLTEVEKNK